MDKQGRNIIDFVFILIKWKKLIIANFLMITLMVAIYSLVMPKTYHAVSTILPPGEESLGMGLSGLLSGTPFSEFGFGAASEKTFHLLAILNSRTIMESAAFKYDLIERYKAKNLEEAVKRLRENVSSEINEDGTISVGANVSTEYFSTDSTEDEARYLASDIANFFISELDRINKEKQAFQAKQNRIFIEKRYLKNLEDLETCENSLKSFQEGYGIIVVEDQAKAMWGTVAEINAQIISKEIEIEMMNINLGKGNVETRSAVREKEVLEKQLSALISGKQGKTNVDKNSLFPPMDSLPNLTLQYTRLYRNVLLQEKILEFLLPQYEQSKLQEAKDTPTVQVLDAAVPPIKRIKPKRSLFVLGWGMLSIVFLSVIVVLIENFNMVYNEKSEKSEKLRFLLQELKIFKV